MDSFFNLSPLNTTVSGKVILFSYISPVNLMVLMVGFITLFNKKIPVFIIAVLEGGRYRQHIVSILLAWFCFVSCISFVSISAMKIFANDTAILVPMTVPCVWR